MNDCQNDLYLTQEEYEAIETQRIGIPDAVDLNHIEPHITDVVRVSIEEGDKVPGFVKFLPLLFLL